MGMDELIRAGEELDAAALNFAMATTRNDGASIKDALKRLSAAQDAWRAVATNVRLTPDRVGKLRRDALMVANTLARVDGVESVYALLAGYGVRYVEGIKPDSLENFIADANASIERAKVRG